MGVHDTRDWSAAAASALDWWRDAGVDVLVEETAYGWLDAVAEAAPAAPDAAALPTTLAAFAAWRAGEAMPDAGWHGPAVSTHGDPASDWMVLVDCPERDQPDCLLGGAAGRLFDRMLAAVGQSREGIYLASVCCKRPAAGRVPRDVEARLGEIVRHHVALAAPRHLLVMGDAASRAILSANVGERRGGLHALNHADGTTGHAVTTFHPRFLLDQPAAKAEAWKDLLLLTEDQPK